MSIVVVATITPKPEHTDLAAVVSHPLPAGDPAKGQL
jgi:hypothetical protein